MNVPEPYRGGGDLREFVEMSRAGELRRSPDNIDFAWLYNAFRRRLWTFTLTFAGTVLLIILVMVVIQPVYTGTARIAINPRVVASEPDKETPVVSQLPVLTDNIDTETQVIQSRRVAARVVDKLHLEKDPEFNGTHVGFKQMLTRAVLALLHAPKASSRRDMVIDNVLANLDPERFLATNAIDINFKDPDPVKAKTIANAFAQAYLDDQVDAKMAQNRKATEALLSQIAALRNQAASDAARVEAYKVSHNLLSVGGSAASQTLTQSEIANYEQEIANLKAQAAADEATLRTAQEQIAHGSIGDDVTAVLSSSTIPALRAQRATVSAKLADLEAHYGPKYPDLAQARGQLADIDQEIKDETRRDISSLSAKAAISQKRLASFQSTLDQTKRTLAGDNVALAGLDGLTQAAAVSQAIYEAYLSRFKESSAQVASLAPDADIISPAGLPTDPSFPVIWLFLLLGVVAGLLFACAAVLIAEMAESRLATPQDVEQKIGRPCLGGIPLLSSVVNNPRLSPLNAVVTEPRSAFSEAFRGLLASINLAGAEGALNVVLVTSALPREGKTTTAVGLARTSALQGAPTVLIDCDARERGLTREMGIDESGPGLIEVLRGEAPLAEALRLDKASGAFVLPMLSNPRLTDELIGGEAMDRLIATLRESRHAVILDAPALQIAVARRLAAKADATLLVTRWMSTSEGGLRGALRLLPYEHVPLIGVALNAVDMSKQSKYGLGIAGQSYKKYMKSYA
jgi:uncharacterized protein involved in exopolysaccharide biosynthesis/Mrp family chromosome partitioning ATPase